MAWGEVVQYASTGVGNQTLTNSFVDVAFTSDTTEHNAVVVFANNRASKSATFTVSSSQGGPLTHVYGGWQGLTARVNAWVILPEDVQSGPLTVRIAWTGQALSWSDFQMVEMEADQHTELDLDSLAFQHYSENPILPARQHTTHKNSFCVGTGNQHFNGGAPHHVTTFNNCTHLFSWGDPTIANRLYGDTFVGGPFTDWTYHYEGMGFVSAGGANIDGDGVIISFGKGAKMRQPAVTGTPLTYNIADEQNSNGGAAAVTFTHAKAAAVAGDLLVMVLGFSEDPGTITRNDATDDGWTLFASNSVAHFYYKVATGADDANLTWNYTNTGRCGASSASFRLGGSLINASTVPGEAVGGATSGTNPLPTEDPGLRLWIGMSWSGQAVSGASGVHIPDTDPISSADWVNIEASGPGSNFFNTRIDAVLVTNEVEPRFGGSLYEDPPLNADAGLGCYAVLLSWGIQTPLTSEGEGPGELYKRRHVSARALPYSIRRSTMEDVPWHEAYPQAGARSLARTARARA